MDKLKKKIKLMINNPDVLHPSNQFPGIVLEKDEFITFNEFLELSRQETVKKYTTLRDIANTMIKKDGIIQGVAYSEDKGTHLTLLFRNDKPLDYQAKLEKIEEKTEEELEYESIRDKFDQEPEKQHTQHTKEEVNKVVEARDKLRTIEAVRNNGKLNLEDELKEYRAKYKEYLELIKEYSSPLYVRARDGLVVPSINDQSENYFAAYDITEDILYYLLNASNLTSDIEIEFVREYYNELMRYKEAIDNGILYPDFDVCDYTGDFNISTNHTRFFIYKPENALNIPTSFGLVKIHLYNPSLMSDVSYSLTYNARNDSSDIKSSLGQQEMRAMLNRGFIHKALLPEAYRKY